VVQTNWLLRTTLYRSLLAAQGSACRDERGRKLGWAAPAARLGVADPLGSVVVGTLDRECSLARAVGQVARRMSLVRATIRPLASMVVSAGWCSANALMSSHTARALTAKCRSQLSPGRGLPRASAATCRLVLRQQSLFADIPAPSPGQARRARMSSGLRATLNPSWSPSTTSANSRAFRALRAMTFSSMVPDAIKR